MNKSTKDKEFVHSLKLLAKTSVIVFIGIFLSKILGYIYRIIIARYFGPEGYGLFSLATMILGWVMAICSLGLIHGISRFIPQYREKKKNNQIAYLFKFTNRILIITSILSAVLLFSLSSLIAINIFHNSELTSLLKILSFFIPIAVLSSPFLEAIRGYEFISSYSFVYNILQNIIRVLSLVLLIMLGFQASSTIISYCLGFLVVLVVSYLICRYKIPELFLKSNLPKKEKLNVKKAFISYSIPLLFFGIVSMLFYWVDSFFLGYFKGVEAVGLYNAAVPIAILLGIMPELFMQLFFPMINRHYSNKSYELIKQLSKQLGKWVFMANLPIFILIFAFPGAAINLLFGSQYLIAETALRILIFGSFIASIGIISNNLLSMAGKSKIVLADIVIATIANILLNIILIPKTVIFGLDNSLGINGAAIATALSVIFLNILFFFQAKRYLGIMPLRSKMINIFLMGLIPAVILLYLRAILYSRKVILVALLAIGFLGAYALLVLLSKSLDKNDWNILLAILAKLKGFYKKD